MSETEHAKHLSRITIVTTGTPMVLDADQAPARAPGAGPLGHRPHRRRAGRSSASWRWSRSPARARTASRRCGSPTPSSADGDRRDRPSISSSRSPAAPPRSSSSSPSWRRSAWSRSAAPASPRSAAGRSGLVLGARSVYVRTSSSRAFVVFAVATLFTPGPNNVMLMTSGLNFGFAPHAAAHARAWRSASASWCCCVGLGLGAIFAAVSDPLHRPQIRRRRLSSLPRLADRHGRAGRGDGEAGGRPLTFLQAAAFQWVKPRAGSWRSARVTSLRGDPRFPVQHRC